MADEKKISGLTEASDASASDEFVVVNKGVTTGQDASASGQTSKITLDNLRNAILGGSGGSTGGDVVFDGKVEIRSSGSDQEALLLLAEGDNDTGGIEFSVLDSSTYKHTITHNDSGLIFSSNHTGGPSYRPYAFMDGNVGIGTNQPGTRLSVATDNSATVGSFISTNASGVSGSAKVVHIENNTATGNGILTGLNVDISGASTATKYSAIILGGNVGIGTPSPDAELDVIGEISSGHNISSNSEYKCFSIRSSRSVDDYGGLGKDYWTMKLKTPGVATTGLAEGGDHRVGNLVFQGSNQVDSSSMIDVMTLGYNGKVGIGTTGTPTVDLEIRNSGQTGKTGLHIWNDADGDPGAQGMVGAYTAWGTKKHTSTSPDFSYHMGIDMTEEVDAFPSLKIGFALDAWSTPDNSNKLVTIEGTGRVGIGTESPHNQLEVICPENTPFVGIFRDYNINAEENEGGAGTGIRFGAKANVLDETGASTEDSEYNQVGALLAGGLYPAKPGGDPATVANKGHMYMQTLGLDGDMHTRMYIDERGATRLGDLATHHDYYLTINANGNTALGNLPGGLLVRADTRSTSEDGTDPLLLVRGGQDLGDVFKVTVNGTVSTKNAVGTLGMGVSDLDNIRTSEANGLDSINNLVVSDFEKDGLTKTGIVAEHLQQVFPHSVTGFDEEYKAVVAEAEGRVVKGLGTDDEREYCPRLKKSDFENPEHTWDPSARFVETKAEETVMLSQPLATSNEEVVAMLVKAVQELSAKVDELSK